MRTSDLRILSVVLVLIIGLTSCSKFGKFKKRSSDTAVAVVEEEVENVVDETGSEMAPTDPIQVQPTDSLFMSYERTPCHGRCPIFKIRLYQSGYVTYEGINFVDYMGYYKSRVDEARMEKFRSKIDEIGYFDLEDAYDDEKLMDLPSMIFHVNDAGLQKKILARYQTPEKLTAFGLFIEQEFKDTKWVPVTHDH